MFLKAIHKYFSSNNVNIREHFSCQVNLELRKRAVAQMFLETSRTFKYFWLLGIISLRILFPN